MERKATRVPAGTATVVTVGDVRIGHDPFPVIAGPCAVESESQIMGVAEAVAEAVSELERFLDGADDDHRGLDELEERKALYEELVARGRKSLVDALTVGATIEDLDIHDLEGNIADTEKPDLLQVYGNLLRGSANHLRAFVRLLEGQDIVNGVQQGDQLKKITIAEA